MNLESYSTPHYRLDIESNETIGNVTLADAYSGVKFADGEYRYSAFVESEGTIHQLEGLYSPSIDEELTDRGDKIVCISGRLGKPGPGPAIEVRHKFRIPEDEAYLEEQIILQNLGECELVLRGYRFGFRKHVERSETYGGPGLDIERYRLIALPFRLQPDGKKHDYTLDDIYLGRYQCSEMQNPMRVMESVVDKDRGRSEGWAWSDGENGLLIMKYNPDMVEYSMLETEKRDDGVYLNFGGAAPCLFNEPFAARRLGVHKQMAFGISRFHFYEGLWRRGSYMFRDYMSSRGHGLPDNYNPSVHWNELYNVGWYHGDPDLLAKHYTLDALEREARRAADTGCEALYLDPGWETCEGSTQWDDARLGDAEDFVRKIKVDYGLQVAFRTIGRSYCDSYPGMYRRTQDGRVGFYAAYHPNPFYEPCICSEQYREEKLKRLLKIAGTGMNFITFDEFDWRGPCFDPNHGHSVPTTPSMHAEAVVDIIRKVHEKYPQVNIEAHDPVWPWGVRYLPIYLLHDMDSSFNEVWAFEFMWNPLDDLLSGKALSLFYYNLAYDVPLYLHINMNNDNDNCLAFWWYASTVRHLGIGGGKDKPTRFDAYRRAMKEYMSLKDLYTQGTFYGIDELVHLHVIPEEGRAVVNAFNLTDTPMSRKVEIRLNDLGLLDTVKVEGAQHQVIGGRLVFELNIPPFSPMLVKLLPE